MTELADGVRDLLSQLEPVISTAKLPSLIQSHADAQMRELAAAAQEPAPDPKLLKKGLRSLGKVFEGAAGNIVASGAVAAINALLD